MSGSGGATWTAQGGVPRSVWLSGITAAVLLGLAIGTGRVALVAAGVAAIIAVAVAWRWPLAGVVASVLVAASVPFLADGLAADVGPLTLHWTDIGLLLAMLCAGVHLLRRGAVAESVAVAMRIVAPVLAVVAAKAVVVAGAGASWQAVGVGLRIYAWYLALPLFTEVLADVDALRHVQTLIHGVAAVTAVAVVVGNLNAGLARSIATLGGGRTVVLPGQASLMARVVFPGMSVVPLALALLVGSLLYVPGRRFRWFETAAVALYAASLLVTFARGMWLWTVISFVVVLLMRADARVIVRVAAAVVALVMVAAVADVAIGRTPELPQGLFALVAARAGSLAGGDANTAIRQLEDTEVVRQTSSHELLGVSLEEPLGVGMLVEGGATMYTVHNSYYAVYGRFGLLGLVGLLLVVVTLWATGIRAVMTASGPRLAMCFAGMVGIVRATLSAWTQTDVSSTTGIVVLMLAAALLLAAHDVMPEETQEEPA